MRQMIIIAIWFTIGSGLLVANPITFTFENTMLTEGGTITGSFEWDITTGAYSNIDLQISQDGPNPPTTDTGPASGLNPQNDPVGDFFLSPSLNFVIPGELLAIEFLPSNYPVYFPLCGAGCDWNYEIDGIQYGLTYGDHDDILSGPESGAGGSLIQPASGPYLMGTSGAGPSAPEPSAFSLLVAAVGSGFILMRKNVLRSRWDESRNRRLYRPENSRLPHYQRSSQPFAGRSTVSPH
jgi:hypothetical protein